VKLRRFFDRLRGRETRAAKPSPKTSSALDSLGPVVRSRIVGTDSLAFAPPGHELRRLGELERELEQVRLSCEALSVGHDALAARARDVCAQIEASFGPPGEVRVLLEFWPASWDLAAPRVTPIMARLTRLRDTALELREVARLREAYRIRATALHERYARPAAGAVDALLSSLEIDRTVEQMRSPDEGVRAMQRLDLLEASFAGITVETSASLAVLRRIAPESGPVVASEPVDELAVLRDRYLGGQWQRLMQLEEAEERRADALLALLRRPNERTVAMRSRTQFGGEQEGALQRWILLHLAGHGPARTRRT
jgi:hypothetical protein